MDIRKLIKKDAWLAMRNNWGKAFAIVLISFSFLIFTVLIEKLLSYILDVSYFIDYAQTPAFYLDDITNLGPASFAVLFSALIIHLLIYSPVSLGNKKMVFRTGGCQSVSRFSRFQLFFRFSKFLSGILSPISFTDQKSTVLDTD